MQFIFLNNKLQFQFIQLPPDLQGIAVGINSSAVSNTLGSYVIRQPWS